jgi:tetratricopeptide (TPR) repeat protein
VPSLTPDDRREHAEAVIAAGQEHLGRKELAALAEEARRYALLSTPTPAVVVSLGEAFDSFQDRSDRFSAARDMAEAGNQGAAEAEYRTILTERPDEPEVLRELGSIVGNRGDYAQAERLFRLSLAYEPNVGGTWCLLGATLDRTGRHEEALECYEQALHFSPDLPKAHFFKAFCLMRMGNYREGWEEWRWGRVSKDRRIRFPSDTEWSGNEILGGTLLVWSDQGAGDAVMFSRFLPVLQERFPEMRIVWEVHDSLVGLMAAQEWAPDLILKLQLDGGMPVPFDAHVELADLPMLLGLLDDAHFTIKEPYLAPDPALLEKWRPKIAGEGLKVGYAFKGNPKHPNDMNRSMPKEAIHPLLQAEGCTFYDLGLDGPLGYRTWADTAAIVELLDVVVTVDTGLCHLAGAMGQKVLTLLPLAGDWRWGMEGDETVWYPSMTLLWQERFGDWTAPVCRAAAALEGLVNAQ